VSRPLRRVGLGCQDGLEDHDLEPGSRWSLTLRLAVRPSQKVRPSDRPVKSAAAESRGASSGKAPAIPSDDATQTSAATAAASAAPAASRRVFRAARTTGRVRPGSPPRLPIQSRPHHGSVRILRRATWRGTPSAGRRRGGTDAGAPRSRLPVENGDQDVQRSRRRRPSSRTASRRGGIQTTDVGSLIEGQPAGLLGLMYETVPTTVPSRFGAVARWISPRGRSRRPQKAFASPKSRSLTVPSG